LRQLPLSRHRECGPRKSADLFLFDEVAAAFAASLPSAAAERDCIREVADAAAELTRHRDPKTIAVAAASTAKTPTDHHVFFRPEPVLGWWPEPNATLPRDVLGRRVVMEVDGEGYRPVPGQPAIGDKV